MIKPLRDYVVLEKIPDEKKIGNIIIATSHENESAVALVIAVGPGYTDNEGHEIKVQAGRKLMLIQDKDILAVVD